MSAESEALIEYCRANQRISPKPRQWHDFWMLLRSVKPTFADTEPPKSLILSDWWYSTDEQKWHTLREQIDWADQHGVLPAARKFLRALATDDWLSPDQRRRPFQSDRLDRQRRREQKRRAHQARKAAKDAQVRALLPQDLIAAYTSTRYETFAAPAFVLRIGEASADLRLLYRRRGIRSAAFLTAWNPYSRPTPLEQNKAAQTELRQRLAQEGLSLLEGEGRGADGDWPPEPSILALGCSKKLAKKLGRQFGQNAIVWAGANGVPQLILLHLMHDAATSLRLRGVAAHASSE